QEDLEDGDTRAANGGERGEVEMHMDQYAGLPVRVLDGSGQEFGQTSLGEVSEAIRTSSGNTGAGRHNVTTTAGCGSSGNPATGGAGASRFADPGAVSAIFRPTHRS